MTGMFDAYGHYYDMLYSDKNYVEEVHYIDRLLNAHGTGRKLLEFGCGTGKHGRLLAERGYTVLGVERSPEMIARADQTKGFSAIQGDVCHIRLGQTFDAVLSLFHVVSYQTTNASVSALFECAAEHLRAGGVFIFDIWYTPAVYSQKPIPRVKRLSDDQVDIIRVADPRSYPNENRVDVNYTIVVREKASGRVRVVNERHPMRHFSLPELDLIAAQSGFERVSAEGFLSGSPPGEDTWGVCLIMRKK
jgi:SAM-dependent methyltransferase